MNNRPDTTMIIERAGNGYILRPLTKPGDMYSISEVMVFQDKGFVSASRDNQRIEDTLFGWLDRHFSDAEPSHD